MKKFLTLIKGETVQRAPQTKRIPAADYSALVTGEELIAEVKKQIEEYRLDVEKEAEEIKEKARQEGFNAGMEVWAGKIQELEQEIQKVHEDLVQMVIPVALKAAKKIVGREIELSKTAIVDIVAANLKAVAHHQVIKIYVSPQDFEAVEKSKEGLKTIFEKLDSLSVIAKEEVEDGGCIIETEGGIINAQLDNLWRIMENAFSSAKGAKQEHT